LISIKQTEKSILGQIYNPINLYDSIIAYSLVSFR